MFSRSADLNKFFQVTGDPFCVLHEGYKLKDVNPAFENLIKLKKDKLMDKNILEFIHQDDRSATETTLNNLARVDGEHVELGNRIVASDGTNRWLSWSFHYSESFIYSLGEDKTNEKQVEGELMKQNREIAKEKAKTEAMLGNIGDGVIALSDKGEINYMNKSAEDILKINQNDVMGKLYIQAINAVNEKGTPYPTEKRPIRNAMLTGRTAYSRDIYYVRSDKKTLPVAITASPVMTMGQLIGGVIVFRDITKEKEIDRMKTEFISLASHQLRTPLSAMKWFSEMLLDGDMGQLNPEQHEVVGNIYNSNERMIDLVNSLLNISRIESGRMIVDPQPTNLKELVDTVIFELQPKVKEKGHNLALSVHGELPMINVDPKLIRHVYMNLLTNSIKYTPPQGEIVVLISRSQDGQNIVSQVSDNGYGIPKSQHDRVFQKFFRADNVVKVETDGTGLGLYLLKSIVESSGGKIWFASEEGKGTTFWFSLPITGSKAREGEVTIDS